MYTMKSQFVYLNVTLNGYVLSFTYISQIFDKILCLVSDQCTFAHYAPDPYVLL